MGKVFPKTSCKEKVVAKLDFQCVGLEKDKDKDVSLPTVYNEKPHQRSHETEERVLSAALKPGEGQDPAVSDQARPQGPMHFQHGG